jgi:hypothetical protein
MDLDSFETGKTSDMPTQSLDNFVTVSLKKCQLATFDLGWPKSKRVGRVGSVFIATDLIVSLSGNG